MDRTLALLSDRLRGEIETHLDSLIGSKNAIQFRESMARSIIRHQAAAYMLGAETKRLSLEDQRVIAESNRFQLGFLDQFVEQIAAGDYDNLEAQLRARAVLYAGSVKTPYSQGQTKGLPLPFHPGQGSPCMGNCKCAWRIAEVDGGYDCYWQMGAAEKHCSTCPSRASNSPYRIRSGRLV